MYFCCLEKYFIHIAYNGFHYRGWQRQIKRVKTVQGIIEEKLSKVFGYPINAIGCGRTDAMVHANQYVFHIWLNKKVDFDFIFRMNKVLPNDIAVYDIRLMHEEAHARYDATKRTYNYFAHFFKDPLFDGISAYYLLNELDFEKMALATKLFLKYNDYYALCRRPDFNKHTLCEVSKANLYVNARKNRFRLEISSNRFLRGMIRIIALRLIEIGMGKLSLQQLESYLVDKKTERVLHAAHPQGLYLSKIEYPYIKFEDRAGFVETLSQGLKLLP